MKQPPIRLAGKPTFSTEGFAEVHIPGRPGQVAVMDDAFPVHRTLDISRVAGLDAEERELLVARLDGITRQRAPGALGWTAKRVASVWRRLNRKLPTAVSSGAILRGGSSRVPWSMEQLPSGRRTYALTAMDPAFLSVMAAEWPQVKPETKNIRNVSAQRPQASNSKTISRRINIQMGNHQAHTPLPDWRTDADLIRFRAERSRIEAEGRQAVVDLDKAQAELQAATAEVDDLEVLAMVDAGQAKPAAAARKRAEALTATVAELRIKVSRYPRVAEHLRTMTARKELAVKRQVQAELAERYRQAVTLMASALDAAAIAREQLAAIRDAGFQQFDAPETLCGERLPGVSKLLPAADWPEIDATDRDSRLNLWFQEVARSLPAALEENHPARVYVRTKDAAFAQREADRERRQAEEAKALNRPRQSWRELATGEQRPAQWAE